MEQMTTVDWVFLLVLLISLCMGLWRGLVKEVVSIASWFVAYAVAQYGAQDLSLQLPLEAYQPPIPYMLAFAALFILSFMLCAFLTWAVRKFLSATGLQPIDRVLGGVFGALRGLLILVVIVSVVHLTPLRSMQWWQASKGQQWVLSAISMFRPVLPEAFTRYLPNNTSGQSPASAVGSTQPPNANISLPNVTPEVLNQAAEVMRSMQGAGAGGDSGQANTDGSKAPELNLEGKQEALQDALGVLIQLQGEMQESQSIENSTVPPTATPNGTAAEPLPESQ